MYLFHISPISSFYLRFSLSLCKLGLELDTYVNYINDNCAWTLYLVVH